MATKKKAPSAKAQKIEAVLFRGPIYMSKETYAALKKYVGVEPPAECHLEVSETPEGLHTYSCVGTCPGTKTCALQGKTVEEGGKKKYVYYCACA